MTLLKGRLGLETARVPHVDRHGLLWLYRGRLYVEDGTLHFATVGSRFLEAGDYTLPFQAVSCILLGPGTTVSHDSLRLLSRHGTGLVAVGEDGVRFYASMPFGPDSSRLARRQVQLWSDEIGGRGFVARKMYAWRLGEILPSSDISVLRGIEGARVKQMYKQVARRFGIEWKHRRYDRADPERTDPTNAAINHAATAVLGASMIAVASTATIPQLGFIHEDSGNAFCLDIADLFRDTITLPVAFGALREHRKAGAVEDLEKVVRRSAGRTIQDRKVIPDMIDRIKGLFDDSGSDA